MNKNDLIAEVADDTGLSKSDAARAVDAVFDAITKALKKNNEVRLVGFGTFSVAKREVEGTQSPHWRRDPDPGIQAAEVQGRQGTEGRGELKSD